MRRMDPELVIQNSVRKGKQTWSINTYTWNLGKRY